jgi:hypothetical protein
LVVGLVAAWIAASALYLQQHLPLEQALSYITDEEMLRVGRAVWVRDDRLNRRLGCDPDACDCVYVEVGYPRPRTIWYFQARRPLCVRNMPLRDVTGDGLLPLVHVSGVSLWYTNDVTNPYHITHFCIRPIFDFMVRMGLDAGEVTIVEPQPRAKLPGPYGLRLVSEMGPVMWTEDAAPGSGLRFDDLWVRLTGEWLYPTHKLFTDDKDPDQPMARAKMLDPRWALMSAFFRRRLESTWAAPEEYGSDMVLLLDRGKSRKLRDSGTKTFEEVARVLRGGGLNLRVVRFEDVGVEEQLALVMNAKVYVAVHGAALTNMIYQPPLRSAVVEIVFPPRLADYHNMAWAVGRPYHVFWADSTENKVDSYPAAYEWVNVNSTRLLHTIQDALDTGEPVCC